MSITLKIEESFFDEDFQLLALHTAMEDHAMAYALNAFCGLHLRRTNHDLEVGTSQPCPMFVWENEVQETYWTLIKNKIEEERNIQDSGLFGVTQTASTSYVLQEHKEVDYLLKVEGNEESLQNKLQQMRAIPKLLTAYEIQTNKLKSKRNLIF
ncbi:MAG: IPExxxVDY family protein [Bacteroidota bacterium]